MNTEQLYAIYKTCNKVVIDSRKIEKEICFCFSGESFDAATQAEAINKGAIAVVIENPDFNNPENNIFCFPSTLHTLQDRQKNTVKSKYSNYRINGKQW